MLFRLVAFAFVVAGCSRGAPPAAPKDPSVAVPLAIGETFQLESTLLGERRVINVYLPPGYAEAKAAYPVLYMPDGGIAEDFPHVVGGVDVSIKNGVIRPLIVVGIENTERRRDLPGPTTVEEEQKMAPHAGGSDTFRGFLRDELKPAIAKRYRVTSESAIIGESLAGLFVIETFLVEPSLFDAYISVDPSVWWNQQALVHSAAAKLASWHEAPKTLFVATADYKETQDAIAVLLDAITTAAPAGLTVKHAPMPEEQHSTIYPFAGLRGVRTVFRAN
jgi:predicted alpha/beta superfamily hydrolase